MRVVNELFEDMDTYDLTSGELFPAKAVRKDAKPIDNVTKYAWDEDDWEEVQMYIPDPQDGDLPTQEARKCALEKENRYLKETLEIILSGAIREEVSGDGESLEEAGV